MPAAEAAAVLPPGTSLDAGTLFAALDHEQRIAVAVSGGSDSMALLRLLACWKGHGSLVALTVDHGLREGSRGEAEQVGRWCASLGITHVILTWEGVRPRSGIQAKARTARYGLMTTWCRDNHVPVLLTAHTLNDQAETVAMRKARTTRSASLAGIWPETCWDGVRIVRPLLGVRRAELRGLLRGIGQGWLDDPSNENEAFERVRVRRALRDSDMDVLAAEAEQALARTRVVQTQGRSWVLGHAVVHWSGLVTLPRQPFLALPDDIQIDAMGRVIAACGSGIRPETAELGRLAAAIRTNQTLRLSLGGALIAGRQREILVGREAGRIAERPVAVPACGELVWDGRFRISAPPGTVARVAGPLRPPVETGLPAFVCAALPVLEIGADRVIFPHFDRVEGVAVTLGERFRL